MTRAALLGPMGVAAAAALAFGGGPRLATSPDVVTPAPAVASVEAPAGREVVVFSGGCFWGVQAVFEHVKGVLGAASGYAGGSERDAEYRTVSTGRTGHAESVRVVYDPEQVSFAQLMRVFFSVAHDPTQLNRQGPDHGSQYRSAIWYTTPEQGRQARAYIDQMTRARTFDDPIVTEVNELDGFYAAEDYHQDYLVKHPRAPYIVYNDLPKLRQLEKAFPGLWRDEPVAWNGD